MMKVTDALTGVEKLVPIDSKRITATLPNVQILPATQRVEINDKFTKTIFKSILQSGGGYTVTERKASKNSNGKIQAPIKTNFIISNYDDDEISLSEFDRAVLSAVISEQKVGNLYTTIPIIYRALTGKVGKGATGVNPEPNQREIIKNSLVYLMSTNINFTDAQKSLLDMGYIKDPGEFDVDISPILPAQLLHFKNTINGQMVKDVLYFTVKSPLLEYAELKNQIVRYPSALLDIPNQNNTPLIIMLKTYVLRRISEIKLHRQLAHTITFNDVFKKCGLTDANRDTKYNARKIILQLFEHLKAKNFIKSYEIEKRGNFIHSVKFF